MLPTLLVIDPLPDTLTVKARLVGTTIGRVKAAVTLLAAFIDTLQLAVPLHAPLHPEKVNPDVGVAVIETCCVLINFAVQVEEQLMPDGELLTRPPPVTATVSANDSGGLIPSGT